MGGVCSGYASQNVVKTHDSTMNHHIISTAKNPRNPHFQGDPSRRSSLLGISLNQTPSMPNNASLLNDHAPVNFSGRTEMNRFFYDETGTPIHDIGQRRPSAEMSRSRNGRTPRTPRRASMPNTSVSGGGMAAPVSSVTGNAFSRTESDPSSEAPRPKTQEPLGKAQTRARRKSMTDLYDVVYQWEGGQILLLPDATAKSGWANGQDSETNLLQRAAAATAAPPAL